MRMNFKEFVDAVVLYFEQCLGEEYVVSVNEVSKNNSTRLTGILLKKKGQKVSPNIYLNSFYEQYIESSDMEAVLKNIWDTYRDALRSLDSQSFDFDFDFEAQKEYVVYRLINYKENEEKLAVLPHIRFLDLAITFYCSVYLKEETVSMLPITNALMRHWDVDMKCLLKLAHQNTPRLFPAVCSALEEVVRQLVDEEEFSSFFTPNDKDAKMYVMSNEQGIYGATVMLYEEAFQYLAESLGEKLYILPSSIHELIVIPYEEGIESDKLSDLVREVNQTQVPWEDILSNHVYLYSSKTRSFEIL